MFIKWLSHKNKEVIMFSLDQCPIGIYEKALPKSLTWEEKLIAAKLAGYDYVEISIDESDERLQRLYYTNEKRQEIVQAVYKTGIKIPTMCLSGHRRYPLGSESIEIRSKGLEIMKLAIEFAVDVGIRVIQLAGYDVYYEKSNDQTKNFFFEGLRQSVEWASHAGVVLAIEVMDYEFMGSVKKIMAVVEEINSPYLQVYPDFGNITAWGSNIDEDLATGTGHIVAIHLKDTHPGEFRRISFGEGTVDFVKGFKQLKKMNYAGPLLIEMWTDDSEDFMLTIASARKWILGQMEEAGFLKGKKVDAC